MMSKTIDGGRPVARLDRLRRSSDLEVSTPEDSDYDAGRMTWNTVFEHRPAVVARPRSVAGVVAAVGFARENSMPVAIQSTGHGPSGEVTDGVLIDMSHMTGVSVDPDARLAVVGGGAKWGAVVDVVAPHGLAPLLGSAPDVGAVGYTLGGGLGWLARKYGTAADSVRAFEVVTADGRVVRASAEQEPDLFWALRGAGAGCLGVVTSMEIGLYPVSTLYAGNLYYPADAAIDVARRWRDWLPTVPEALTSALTLMNYPPFEMVPEEIRGRSFAIVRGAFDGPIEVGQRLLSYWRDWRAPQMDLFGPLPFEHIAQISQDPVDPIAGTGTGLWMAGLSDSSIDELVRATFGQGAPPMLLFSELRHVGGAVARGISVPAAFGNREALMILQTMAATPTPDSVAVAHAEIERIRSALAADLTGGHYLNYIDGDERRSGVRGGVGASSTERLAEIKARFDPGDLFAYGLDL